MGAVKRCARTPRDLSLYSPRERLDRRCRIARPFRVVGRADRLGAGGRVNSSGLPHAYPQTLPVASGRPIPNARTLFGRDDSPFTLVPQQHDDVAENNFYMKAGIDSVEK